MTDTPLLDWAPPFQKHSPTSRAAAEAIKPRVGPMHQKIIHRLTNSCGLTDEEMQFELDMSGSTQRPRRRELQAMGMIVDSGRTRRTESGRQAVVWMLAENR